MSHTDSTMCLSKISMMFGDSYGTLFQDSLRKNVTPMTQEELCSFHPHITDSAKEAIRRKLDEDPYIKQSIAQIESCLCIGASGTRNIGQYWDDAYVRAVVCLCCLIKENHHGVEVFPEVKPFKLMLSLNLNTLEKERVEQLQTVWSNTNAKHLVYFSMTCDLAEIIAEAITQST